MERKIGDTFEFEGKKLQVKAASKDSCEGCILDGKCTRGKKAITGFCERGYRDDGKNVIFVEMQEQPQKTEAVKERQIGEVFEYEGKKLKVVKAEMCCGNCFFYKGCCCTTINRTIGECKSSKRSDNESVVFVEITEEQAEQPQELNLCEVLKYCPYGEPFWSPLFGYVKLHKINHEAKKVVVISNIKMPWDINNDGTMLIYGVVSSEIMLFPSKEQRDWTKVKYEKKKERFDPKTLSPFDRVLARNHGSHRWTCDLFSNIIDGDECMFHCINSYYRYCIPYNDDTKHLLDTKEEAPVFYRYWED